MRSFADEVKRRGIKLSLIFVLFLSLIPMAIGLNITPSPPSENVTNVTGETIKFEISLNYNSNVTWYFNGTEVSNGGVQGRENVQISNYTTTASIVGVHNISVVARNVSNLSDIANWTWWWAVANPPESNTTPEITNPTAINITDTGADITFTVNQSDAKTNIRYAIDESLGNEPIWNNETGLSRTIPLSGLSKATMYYYSVYAYNGSNQSYFSNSSIQNFTTLDPTAPSVTNVTRDTPTSTSVNITFSVNQSNARTGVHYGKTEALEIGVIWNNASGSPRTIKLSNLDSGTKYYYSVFAYNNSNQSYYSNSSIYNFTTKYPPPSVTGSSPSESTVDNIAGEFRTFSVISNQVVNITWYLNGSQKQTNYSVLNSTYTAKATQGTWNVTAVLSNENGTTSKTWTWIVRSRVYYTGNRVWDETKGLSRTYTWTPQSFSGFFYDLDSNVGTENITIKNIQRSIREGDLEYTTSPQLISFDYGTWGRYQVIGFMAEKYFAGYVSGETSSDITDDTISTLNNKQLHKVLLDDETKRVLYAGSTLSLKDGYALRAKDVDVSARIILLALIKDGDEVDIQPVEAGRTYVYTKKVGGVSDLPIIAVRFESVFSGREVNAAFIKGVFQLSESYLTVSTGNRYGIMEITTVSASQILMENDASISLSEGSTIDLMGDIKIKVADNSSVIRFAPFVQKTGIYELRGTVATGNDTSFNWTPMNFEGFYYDLDEDVGTESLEINPSGRSVSDGNLIYSTTPQLVSFDYSKWGSYRVIGFMAEKYFAGYVSGYTHSDITSDTISTLNSKQLHKVLLDDETKRVLYAGSTLSLRDGYALRAKDVDVSARIILLALIKDGSEVDIMPVEAGKTYVYTKKVGGVSDLPILAVHFDSVFSGREVNAAFIKGIFQLSESYSTVNTGASYGIMEVRSVGDSGIEMTNDASFDLSSGSTIDVMGKIKFKVADSGDIRYYPFILVNASELAANRLVIDAPDKAAVADNITIRVTAGGSPVEGVSLTLGTIELNSTNSQGISNYTLTKSGTFNITATKLGYEKATRTIVVEEFATNRLVIDIPSKANQGEVLSIKVTANNTPISGVNITFDNQEIGLTNSLGILNYTPNITGTHTIGAYKLGYRTAAKNIDVIPPYSEFVTRDLNITPSRVAVNQPVLVKANVTNIGTKADLHIVELRINETVADTRNVTLKPGEVVAVNFTYRPPKPGNFTVEVGGQTAALEVYEEGLSLLLIGGIATLLGAVAVYLYTMRPETIEEIRRKMGALGSTIGSKLTRHKPKTKEM